MRILPWEGVRTRVAIVGAGFGRYVLAPAFSRDPRCEVVAMCARSSTSLARARAELGIERLYTSVEEMLDAGSVDAVVIATPPDIQPSIALLALARNIPIFVEKLLALTVEDARRLSRDAVSGGVANVVDYIFPELQCWRRAKALIADGFVGSLRHVAVSWMMESHDNRHGLETWKTDDSAGGGALRHFGPHVLHYVEWLVGPIKTLSANLDQAPDMHRPGDTVASLALSFVSGVSGTISLSTAAPYGTGHRIELYGSAGALFLENKSTDPVHGFQLRSVSRGRGWETEEEGSPTPEPTRDIDSRVEPVARLASRFLTWIRTGESAHPSFADGLRVQILLDAVQRAHSSGLRVAVPNTEASL